MESKIETCATCRHKKRGLRDDQCHKCFMAKKPVHWQPKHTVTHGVTIGCCLLGIIVGAVAAVYTMMNKKDMVVFVAGVILVVASYLILRILTEKEEKDEL